MARDRSLLSDNWKTPEWMYKELDQEFNFDDFDPCPYMNDTSKWDGLDVEWADTTFCNPPYNRVDKPKFIKKAYAEWKKGKTVVLLIPAAVSTNDFHDYIYPNAEIRFPRGRIAFEGYNSKGKYVKNKKGMHDSMIVIFRAKCK